MLNIRKAIPSDAKYIVDFQLNLAMETEDLALHRPTVVEGVKNGMEDTAKGQYFVAEKDGSVIGSLFTTYEWSDWRNGTTLWIQSVFVDKDHRGKGVFKSLYLHVKSLVEKDPQYTGIRLYVFKDNSKAKKVYSNLGMAGEHYEIFEWMKTH